LTSCSTAPRKPRDERRELVLVRNARTVEALDEIVRDLCDLGGDLQSATRAQQGIAEQHTGGENPDAHLPRTRSRIILLDHLQELGATVVTNDDAPHASSLLRHHDGSLKGTDR